MASHINGARCCAGLLLATALTAQAQALGGAWEAIGPGPALDGQVEGIPFGEVVGAINAIAPHPSNADILYAGSPNGGIWRTNNATSPAPLWTAQTNGLSSLAIGALSFDPSDPTAQTLVAGVAHSSSYGGDSTRLIGMLRTTDGGANWQLISGGGTLHDLQVNGVAARGAILLAATNAGVFRSGNSGLTFIALSGNGSSGLPAGSTSDLVGDPTSSSRLYVPVSDGPGRGVYRSNNAGLTWTKVSDAAVDASFGGDPVSVVEIAVGNSGQVFVASVAQGRLAAVFRSADGSSPWVDLGVPLTTEQDGVMFGIHPGGQGRIHFSLAADPSNSNLVYVGGDRQPYFGEGASKNPIVFPNSIGATEFTGRLFRGDASAPAATRWVPLTHVGTANNSAPHADSRDMAFDAQGNLIEADDGGVYKRLLPQSAAGTWISINGSLQSTEYHGIAWDAVSDRVVGGAQDTGSTELIMPGSTVFQSVSIADGGDPAVEDHGSTSLSVRYTSLQFFGSLQRRLVDASNVVQSVSFPVHTPIDGSPLIQPIFYTPIAVHRNEPMRLLIAAANGLYESFDRGDTVSRISPIAINAFNGDPLVYGVDNDPDFVLFASQNQLHVRRNGASSFAILDASSVPVWDVDVDRSDANRIFILDLFGVHFSDNGGSSFGTVTGNLTTEFAPGLLLTMAYMEQADAVAVGTASGTYVAFGSSNFSNWARLGSGFPNGPVWELEYDDIDNLLVAGVMGHGAWKFDVGSLSTDVLFEDGFEQTTQATR